MNVFGEWQSYFMILYIILTIVMMWTFRCLLSLPGNVGTPVVLTVDILTVVV